MKNLVLAALLGVIAVEPTLAKMEQHTFLQVEDSDDDEWEPSSDQLVLLDEHKDGDKKKEKKEAAKKTEKKDAKKAADKKKKGNAASSSDSETSTDDARHKARKDPARKKVVKKADKTDRPVVRKFTNKAIIQSSVQAREETTKLEKQTKDYQESAKKARTDYDDKYEATNFPQRFEILCNCESWQRLS